LPCGSEVTYLDPCIHEETKRINIGKRPGERIKVKIERSRVINVLYFEFEVD
jgi:hypothetical protein